MSIEEQLKNAFEEYKNLPKAEMSGVNRSTEIYSNQWCVFTGRSFSHPHPHRHYTFIEFCYYFGKNEDLYNRFLKEEKL